MAKFTKGQWVARNDGDSIGIYVPQVGKVANIRKQWAGGNCEANARLISSAPKLYEALQEVLMGSELDPSNPKRVWARACPSEEAIKQAFQALALVEGKE